MPRRLKENLMLKFRLTITQPMTKEDALRKLKRAVRSGFVPEGIEIHYMDWKNSSEGHYAPRDGRIKGKDLDDLRAFYNALAVADMRAERVD